MSTKKKVSSKNTKATSKKKVAKPIVKKVAAKAKKVASKASATKVANKAKKVVKPVVKKAVKKVVAKASATKAKKIAKPVVKKAAPKKAVKKVVVKASASKAKKTAKPIVKKVAPKKAVKKVLAKASATKVAAKAKKIAKPVKKAVIAKPVKVAKPEKIKIEKVKVEKVKVEKIKPKKQIVAPTTFREKETAAPVKQLKEPAGKFEMEFVIRASEDMVFEFVSTESGLSEWFCDDVTIKNGIFTFEWDGQIQQAQLVKEQPPLFIRYQWLDKNDGSYFEFRTQKDELTNDISLIITDFASDKAEEESAKLLWHSQVDKLLHVLGSFF